MFSDKKYPSHTVETLRSRIAGTVVVRGDKEYDTQRKPWLDVVEQHPSAIVNAASVQDVVETIRTARALELPLGVQNTGHGIAAACDEGILLRLSAMKEIHIDAVEHTAIIGPGVLAGELLSAAEPHGLAFPSGQVSSVGVIGYTLGGGFGWLGRKAGAACTMVRSATVVLADGSVVTARASENPDLFWAIRGGGGNFGVVASMTIGLIPLREIFGGLAYYRMEDAPEVLRFYREWSAGLPDETSSYLRLMSVPPKPHLLLHLLSTKTCAIGICHANPATEKALHQETRSFKEPAVDDLKRRPYSEMASFDEASNEDNASTFSHVECLRELSDGVIDGLIEIANNLLPPLVLLELQQLGGALTRRSDEEMAYTAPTAPFYFKVVSPTLNTTLEELAPITKEVVQSLGDVYTGEISYNWMRGDQQTKVPAVFGPVKYKRLQAVKEKYDPSNLFHLNLNVPPAALLP